MSTALRYFFVIGGAVVSILLFLLASASDNSGFFDRYYAWLLGLNAAVAGALLLLPIHRRRGQVYLPADLLAATGLTPQALLDGSDTAAAGRAIEALVGLGR
ncbi:MAG TPA: squalene/phytoene synthase family protein, partial [Duganella sp.]|uniref:squalene/phytoene synthase family protein n=1 Tax=Duganella sp. TaxID=1904440 RepID=UPI002ED1FD7C